MRVGGALEGVLVPHGRTLEVRGTVSAGCVGGRGLFFGGSIVGIVCIRVEYVVLLVFVEAFKVGE